MGEDALEDMQQRIVDIGTELAEIKASLAFITDTIVKADSTISKVAAEVMPTLNNLMASPMVKMLMPKGAK